MVFLPNEPGDGHWVVSVDLAGFVSVDRGKYKPKKRLDETAITVAKVCKKGWWIKEIIHGKWDTRQTALQIVLAAKGVDAVKLGIEKGSLMNAVMPYLEDVMRQYGCWFNIEPTTHGNQRKEERILWAVQGRLERGRIYVNEDPETPVIQRKDWVVKLQEQMGDFPDPLAHDDLLDSLAYVDQLGGTVYNTGYDADKYDTWQPLDEDAGY